MEKTLSLKKFKNSRLFIFFFYLSAVAFFCLELNSYKYLVGIPFALITLHFVLKKFDLCKELEASSKMKIYAALSTAGVCLNGVHNFYFLRILDEQKCPLSRLRDLIYAKGIDVNMYKAVFACVAVAGAVVGFLFCYALVLFLCKRLWQIIKQNDLISFSRAERIVNGTIFALYAVLVCFAYFKSEAFYYTRCDILLGSDTNSVIVSNNNFVAHGYRAPISHALFGTFSIPFFGITSLVSNIFPFRQAVPLLAVFTNIALLIFTSHILLNAFNFSTLERILGMILVCCTYPHIFNGINLETYVVSFFYVALFLNCYIKTKKTNTLALYGATGVLFTSCAAAIFTVEPSLRQDFKKYIQTLFKLAGGFILILVVLCRLDVFLEIILDPKYYGQWMGSARGLSFSARFLQYLESVPYFFTFPTARVMNISAHTDRNGIFWQAYTAYLVPEVFKANVLGIVILVLCAVSTIVNRKDKLAQFSFFWCVFTFIVTCVIGWGEDGQVSDVKTFCLQLYSLYFGWAYFVLLVLLVKKAAEVLKFRALVAIAFVLSTVALLYVNIPQAIRMLKFCFEYYPLR